MSQRTRSHIAQALLMLMLLTALLATYAIGRAEDLVYVW